MILSKLLFNEFHTMDEINSGLISSDISSTDNGYNLKLAVPGIKSDQISVELDQTKNLIIVEINTDTAFVSKTKKSYKVSEYVDLNSIEVGLESGILEISMKRKEEASRKKLF